MESLLGPDHNHPEAVHRLTPVLRIETLVDGVFAIAMTILVLDLVVPQVADPAELVPRLVGMWPRFAIYAVSFVLLGAYWIAHHSQYRFIERADRIMLLLNIVFLMLVALLPFAASLMGEYPDRQVSAVFYGVLVGLIGVVGGLHWWYVTRDRRFIVPDVDLEFVTIVRRRIALTPVLALLAIGLSFVSTYASLAVYILLPSSYLLPNRLDRYFDQAPEG